MSIDLDSLSLHELQEVITLARKLIEEKKEERIQESYARVVQIASSLGLSVDDLLARGRRKALQPVSRLVLPPRYRNPLNPEETWTGRGKKPRWLVEKLARGITLDDMRI